MDPYLDWMYTPIVYFTTLVALFLFSAYFMYMAVMMLVRTKNMLGMQPWDFIISIANFFLPSTLIMIFLAL